MSKETGIKIEQADGHIFIHLKIDENDWASVAVSERNFSRGFEISIQTLEMALSELRAKVVIESVTAVIK